jgi:D-glycero-alpha-D-manno-heptose-7-phosphate kinase
MHGQRVSPAQLVDESTHVEINVLHHPIGKQDQAAAAYGGLNCFRFHADDSVTIEPHSPVHVERLFRHILIFWTGITRDAVTVLAEQKRNVTSKMSYLKTMRNLAEELSRQVKNGMDIETFGSILDEGWKLKCQLASTITNDVIDSWYDAAKRAGALGGKLCGAGGGGFLLFVAHPDRHDAIKRALSGLEVLDVGYEPVGAQILVATSE